jgi:hypothetical protein
MQFKAVVLVGAVCFLGGYAVAKLTGQGALVIADTHAEKLPSEPAQDYKEAVPTEQKSNSVVQVAANPPVAATQTAVQQSSSTPASLAGGGASINETGAAKVVDSSNKDGQSRKKVKIATALPEISDESIDQFVPEPFNKSLKGMHGKIRNKYIEFAEAETQNDWDKTTENTLNDTLNNGQYGNKMIVEGITCRANLCELKFIEREPNAVAGIMGENQSLLARLGPRESTMTTFSDEKNTKYTYMFISKFEVPVTDKK